MNELCFCKLQKLMGAVFHQNLRMKNCIICCSPLSCPLYFSMSNLSICSFLIRKHENSYEYIKYKIQLRGVSNITDSNDPSKGTAFWENTKRRNKFLIPIIFTLFTIKLVAFRVINIILLLCISISMSLFLFLLPYCPGLFIFHIILY